MARGPGEVPPGPRADSLAFRALFKHTLGNALTQTLERICCFRDECQWSVKSPLVLFCFRLHWVSVAGCRLPLVAMSRGCSSLAHKPLTVAVSPVTEPGLWVSGLGAVALRPFSTLWHTGSAAPRHVDSNPCPHTGRGMPIHCPTREGLSRLRVLTEPRGLYPALAGPCTGPLRPEEPVAAASGEGGEEVLLETLDGHCPELVGSLRAVGAYRPWIGRQGARWGAPLSPSCTCTRVGAHELAWSHRGPSFPTAGLLPPSPAESGVSRTPAPLRDGARPGVLCPPPGRAVPCAVASPATPCPPGSGPQHEGRERAVPGAALASVPVFLKGSCCIFQGAAKIAFATDPRGNEKVPKNPPGRVKQSKEKPL